MDVCRRQAMSLLLIFAGSLRGNAYGVSLAETPSLAQCGRSRSIALSLRESVKNGVTKSSGARLPLYEEDYEPPVGE